MKKGFTLFELMVVIVILSIITVMGITMFRKTNEKIKEQEYASKIAYIEDKAALYASETGYLSTNVEQLVKLGYVEADNEAGDVLSPKDQTRLNNFVVTISKENETYYGHFTDKEESNIDNIDMTNENLEIVVTTINTGKVLEKDEWTQENVILTTKIKNENIDTNTIKKIRWYSNVEIKESEVNNNYEHINYLKVEVAQIMNAGYRVEIEFVDGSKFEARRTIKIDKQAPNVYKEDIRIENEKDYTNTDKTTRILASDQIGSGIAGYYIGLNPDCTSEENTYYAEETEQKELNLDNGDYYACAKDKVGNISQAISFNVKNVDKEIPTCDIIVEGKQGDNGWYTSDVTFSVKATDSGSGVKTKEISETSLTTDTNSFVVTAKVRDKAGNECISSIEVKRDTTAPKCNWSGESTTWTKNNRTIKVACEDSMSGCTAETLKKEWSYTSGTHKTESLSYTIKDNAGLETICQKSANVYVDKEAPTTPTSGAIGAVSGSNKTGKIKTAASGSTDGIGSGVKEYRYLVTNTSTTPTSTSSFTTSRNFTRSCGTSYYAWAVAVDKVGNISGIKYLGTTKDDVSNYSNWGSCDKKCGGGTQTRTNTCLLVTDLSKSCNTQDCCSSVYHVATSECSVTCGGGKYKRKAYSNYDGRHCSSKDDYNGSSCNTQACQTTPSPSPSPETCTATCKIRGTTARSSSAWTCDNHHHTITSYYQIYCRDTSCNVTAATSSPTRVCTQSPYGTADGWELYPD